MARGITNNNPLNVKKTTDRWQGSSAAQDDPVFIKFDDAKWGIRCAARLIILYQDQNGSSISIKQIISKWAPSSADGNPTENYITAVAMHSGINADAQVDVFKYEIIYPIIAAMILFENGIQPYSKSVINEGLKLSGISIPVSSALTSPALTVGGLAGVAGVAQPIVQNISDISSNIAPVYPFIGELVHKAPYMIGAALIIGAIYLIMHEVLARKASA